MNIRYPLWSTCLRCREPRIRRAALALLRPPPKVQGCQPAAALGEQIIIMEEARGAAMNAGHATAYSNPAEPAEPSTASESYLREIHRLQREFVSDACRIGWHIAIRLIPEEARSGPLKASRPRDGLPAGTSDEDIAEWIQSPDQKILRLSRNTRNLPTDTWCVVHEYIPIEM